MNKRAFCAAIALVIVAAVCCACHFAAPAAKNRSVAADPGASDVLCLSHSTLALPLNGALGKLYAFHADASRQLQWSSADSSVAEVSMGCITPAAPGTTVISCTDGVNTASCTVIVRADMDMDYTLQVPDNAMTVAVGDTGAIEYTYTGPGAVVVFSSAPQILQVENSCYKALSAGPVVITCTDGIRYSQCLITVTESAPGA